LTCTQADPFIAVVLVSTNQLRFFRRAGTRTDAVLQMQPRSSKS